MCRQNQQILQVAVPSDLQEKREGVNHMGLSEDTALNGEQIPSYPSMHPASLTAALTEHDMLKCQVQRWFHLDSLAAVDLAIGPNSQVLAIAGDAVLKFQIVNRLFKYPDFTSSAKVLHEESVKYITNKQLASVVAWQLDLHKLLRIYNFNPRDPSKAAVKKLGTAVEALLGVLAMQQPSLAEHVVGRIFCMIGESTDTRVNSPAVSQMLALTR